MGISGVSATVPKLRMEPTIPRSAYLEQQVASIGGRPFVVVSDTHFRDNYEIYCALADHLRAVDVVLVLVTECDRPVRDNVVNILIRNVPPDRPTDLQRRYPFSLFKPLVCERSVTDFCTFRQEEIYSGLSFEHFLDRYTRFISAYDFLFSRGGLFLGMLHDTFKSATASRIAEYYGRPVLLPIQYYWWPESVLFFDTAIQGSREVEARYQHYLANPSLIDAARADAIYVRKARTFISNAQPSDSVLGRLANVWRSRTSPEPFSWAHFAKRRFRRLTASITRGLSPRYVRDVGSVTEHFLLFPMHVAPEASILGAAPELADQFSMIKNIAMNLPLGTLLLVKEHPDQHRARLGAQFYRQLESLPNVRLVHASENALQIIRMKQCAGVVVINGTLGIEAAYEGKRVFVPDGGAAWYSFCGAFDTIRAWDDIFKRLRSDERDFRRQQLMALLLAMDDCVEDLQTPLEVLTPFEKQGRRAWRRQRIRSGKCWADRRT